MSNSFSNFLSNAVNAGGNLRDAQHASRLYVDNFYELAPKAGWIYYVVLNINPNLLTAIPPERKAEFEAWYTRHKGNIGLLAKSVDLPKFTVQTEIMHQYNKKTLVQKQIQYSPVSIVFHDDMANVTTNLWKQYFTYYYADSTESSKLSSPTQITPKYTETKYKSFNREQNYSYGLNNNQTVPFFVSVDIYQLYKKRYTSFKLVNPLIKEWAHDQLDQTQGNRLLTSRMTLDYETVIYNTSPSNKGTLENPGFAKDHYDNTPSPLVIGGFGTNSILGPGGLVAGASEIFGELQNIDTASPLDILNTAIKSGNLARNSKTVSKAGVKEEGYSILNGALSNVRSTPAAVTNLDGTISKVPAGQRISQGTGASVSGISQVIAPAGINLFTGKNTSVNGQTQATQRKLGS
jgi:hypothetical protein